MPDGNAAGGVGGSGGTGGAGGSGGAGGAGSVGVNVQGTVEWLAVEDGTGPWKATTTTSFAVNDKAGRYGVAWACVPATGPAQVEIVQATVAESDTVSVSCQPTPVVTYYDVKGTLNGIPSGGTAYIAIGDVDDNKPTAGAPAFHVAAPAGPNTLVAYSLDSGGSPGKLTVQRGVQFGADTTNFNVNLAGGSALTLFSTDAAGLPAGAKPSGAALLSSSVAGLTRLADTSSTTLKYPTIPGLKSDEFYLLTASADDSTSTAGFFQEETQATSSPSIKTTLNIPPPLSPNAGIGVVAGTATATWGTVAFSAGNGLTAFAASIASATGTGVNWEVLATKGWLGPATSYVFPDFSQTSGWKAAWDFPTSQNSVAQLGGWSGNVTLQVLRTLEHSADYTVLPDGATVQDTWTMTIGTY